MLVVTLVWHVLGSIRDAIQLRDTLAKLLARYDQK